MIFKRKKPKEADNLKTLWLKHREEFLKIYAQEIPQGDKMTLEKALIDLDGKVYYRFTGSSTIMPLERMGKMQDFLTMMSAGLESRCDKDRCSLKPNQGEADIHLARPVNVAIYGSTIGEGR
jgi:hypothetical protein